MPRITKLKVKHAGLVVLNRFPHPRDGGNLFVLNSLSRTGLTLTVRSIGPGKFTAKRFFIIRDVGSPRATRADHAHRKTSEVVFCLHGACDVHLDDGSVRQTIRLNDPAVGIVHGPKLWHSLSHFTKDCVLLVLADTPTYDAKEYISDYETFRRSLS